MSTVRPNLTISGTKTLIRVLDHVIADAGDSGHVMKEVDRLCRKDSVARWRELRNALNVAMPKTYRI